MTDELTFEKHEKEKIETHMKAYIKKCPICGSDEHEMKITNAVFSIPVKVNDDMKCVMVECIKCHHVNFFRLSKIL